MSKQRAIVKTLVTRALKADARAANLVLSMIWRLTDTGEGTPEIEEPLLDDELDVLKVLEERMREGHDDAPKDPEGGKETPS